MRRICKVYSSLQDVVLSDLMNDTGMMGQPREETREACN